MYFLDREIRGLKGWKVFRIFFVMCNLGREVLELLISLII